MTTIADAAAARAQHVRAPADRPVERRSGEHTASPALARVPLQVRAADADAEFNGAPAIRMCGYGSVYETGYEMWDMFGPYTEIVSAGAGAKSLAASPMVEFVVNHGAGGAIPMAHTRNGSLMLSEDETGLLWEALADPTRHDVQTAKSAMERGDLVECSFKFRISSGRWSPDYTEYRIDEYDINRGDVSLVNFGANPTTTSWLPRASLADALSRASEAELRSAFNDLTQRFSKPARSDEPVALRAMRI